MEDPSMYLEQLQSIAHQHLNQPCAKLPYGLRLLRPLYTGGGSSRKQSGEEAPLSLIELDGSLSGYSETIITAVFSTYYSEHLID